jgi:hypothetical protein
VRAPAQVPGQVLVLVPVQEQEQARETNWSAP